MDPSLIGILFRTDMECPRLMQILGPAYSSSEERIKLEIWKLANEYNRSDVLECICRLGASSLERDAAFNDHHGVTTAVTSVEDAVAMLGESNWCRPALIFAPFQYGLDVCLTIPAILTGCV
jgi:hypothetical protein